MWGRFVDTLYMTYLTYSRDNEDNVLALWQPILRTVFLHVFVSLLYESLLYWNSHVHTIFTNIIGPSFLRSFFSSESMSDIQ